MDSRADPFGVWSGRAAVVLLTVGLALRAGYILHHRVNVDEPQHLHVAWAWGQGLLPYRDVFDNHSPLFSFLLAPLIHAFGERPDIVLLARLSMVPLVALTLAMTWVIARRLFSPHVALWAVVIAAVAPDFMFPSVEYRADQAWAAMWMTTLAVLFTGRLTRWRSFAVGVLLGATFACSMKTSLLLLSLIGATIITGMTVARRGAKIDAGWLVPRLAWGLAGLVLVPTLVVAYFAARGAFQEFLYGTVIHNLVPGLGLWQRSPYRVLVLPAALPVIWYVGDRLVLASDDPKTGSLRAMLFATAGGYYAGVQGLWPLVTRQDSLPFVPMAAIVAAAALTQLPLRFMRKRPAVGRLAQVIWLAPTLVAAAESAWTLKMEPVWLDGTRGQIGFLEEVLRLTRPGESVMDMRGESVYRSRPYYYVLEPITLVRIERGLIRDDIPERLVAARTPVAIPDDNGLPERGRAFLNANYVALGRLRVVGQVLGPPTWDGTYRFEVRIPQRYAIVSEHHPADGWLDGQSYRGPRELAAGLHTYRATRTGERTAVVWAGSVERGGRFFP